MVCREFIVIVQKTGFEFSWKYLFWDLLTSGFEKMSVCVSVAVKTTGLVRQTNHVFKVKMLAEEIILRNKFLFWQKNLNTYVTKHGSKRFR